jgi:ATP-dependent Clp protease ATP-binding subunit ClpA
MNSRPRPTTEFWDLLQEATSEAARRGHEHVGSEHLLLVLASTPGNFARSILDHIADADLIANGVDQVISSDDYANAGSNEAWENGELVGHMVVGPDGKPRLQRLPGK